MATAGLRKRWKQYAYDLTRTATVTPVDDPVGQMPKWARPLLEPKRYKCLFGGRGSGKSVATADGLLILATRQHCRILCVREFQNSIKDSSHYLLAERIDALGFSNLFEVQRDRIIGPNNSEFIFKGIRRNVASIKSMAGITHCWVEEAQTITAESWRVLVPTIREPNSEIWVTFNPLNATDPVYQEFVIQPDVGAAYIQRVNWDRNPYFPEVLDIERRKMQRQDPDAYEHIWEGGLWAKSDAQIFNGYWTVEDFQPNPDEGWSGPHYGADFGFAADPTVLVEAWVYDGNLYINRESYEYRLDTDKIPGQWQRDIPGSQRHGVRADSARADTISYLRRHGYDHIVGAKKGPNSIEDGIEFIKSFGKVIIHPRCKNVQQEFRLYSYKVDPNTEKVLRVVVDEWNHAIDSLRYLCEPMLKAWRKRNTEVRRRSRYG